MPRRSDVAAAVIGSGFIGTVHVEALRRIGVRVAGILGTSAERAAASADRLGVAKGYADLDELLADDVQVVHVTSPNEAAPPAGEADPRRGQARRVREAARDDLGGVGRARGAGGEHRAS